MKKLLLFTIIIVLIPFFIIGIKKDEEIIKKIKYGFVSNKVIKVKKSNDGTILKVPLEKYVLGTVAGEVPASFNIEALKAQAVASRTYVLKKTWNNNKEYDVDDTVSNQVYLDDEKLKEKWKDNYENYKNKIKSAVLYTKGEVILYQNNLIDAMFFSTSNGYTENSGDVFSSYKPYLVSVESKWDKEESPVFNTINKVSKKEFLFNLGMNTNSNIEITDLKKTKTGRIKEITINKKAYKASEIRQKFNLKSTSFEIKEESDYIIFNVYGYGHGVGMSQYGANAMAKKGYNYKDILMYYYKDCEIKKIN